MFIIKFQHRVIGKTRKVVKSCAADAITCVRLMKSMGFDVIYFQHNSPIA